MRMLPTEEKEEKPATRAKAVGLARKNVNGKEVVSFSPELALEICERVAEGATLKSICTRENKMPTRQTFHRWVVENPEVARAYAAARTLSAHALEEKALDMAYELADRAIPKEHVRLYEASMAQLRWSAGKRNPSVYSEKVQPTVTVPIQINTSLDMGAGAPVAEGDNPNIYTITASVQPESSVEKFDHEKEMVADAPPLKPTRRRSSRAKLVRTPEAERMENSMNKKQRARNG